jgi:hypothetical protein
MASTNEDVVVLASARQDDGRVLLMRHLPDRGTIELGWWQQEAGAVVAQLPVLELSAEAQDLAALEHVCRQAAAGQGDSEIVASGPLSDGAELAALGSGEEVVLVRRPDLEDRIILSRPLLQTVLTAMLPAAREKLARLGFGLPQHGG